MELSVNHQKTQLLPNKIQSAVNNILYTCGSANDKDLCLIICDKSTLKIGQLFLENLKKNNIKANLELVPEGKMHGDEPPADLVPKMMNSTLILCLRKFSMAHTQARVESSKNNSRFLSLPLYDESLLESSCLTDTDFMAQEEIVKKIAKNLTLGKQVQVLNDVGTSLTAIIETRTGNACPGIVRFAGDLGSPPDIEANISPMEKESNGVIVVNGSVAIPEIGLLEKPLRLNIQNGYIEDVFCDDKEVLETFLKLIGPPKNSKRVLAEIGIGLNPNAVITGNMLTDEGALGTIHFGFGSNYTVGGVNKVDFHIDVVIRDATLKIDNEIILNSGKLT